MPSQQTAGGIFADDVIEEEILSDDHFAFHAEHFGDVCDPARTVAQAGRLDDHVDRRDDHVADCPGGQRKAAHGDHRFETPEGLAR